MPAKKIRVSDLSRGRFFHGSKEEMKPSYLITDYGEKVSRVNLFGTVVEKFEGDNFSSITLDDSTGVVQIREFGNKEFFSSIKVGDITSAIGKVKEYNEEVYIVAEIVKKFSDPNFESLHKLEILEQLIDKMKIANELKKSSLSLEELRKYAKDNFEIDEESLSVVIESRKLEIDYKPKILEVIQALDEGDGVEIGKLISVLNLPENVLESALNELFASGALYEPLVGRLKKV